MASTGALAVDKGKGKQQLDPTERRIPFATSLADLEHAGHRGPSPAAANAILGRLKPLQAPHDPFPRAASTQALVRSGRVELAEGTPTKLSPAEEAVVDDVAARFELDDVEALMAVRALGRGSVEKLVEDDWDALTAHVFEERMAVLGTVTLLLRAHDDPDHACHELAVQVHPSLFTPALVPALLASFVQRTSRSLPNVVRSTPHHANFWAKQLVREQKAILDLIFLVFYVRAPDAPEILAVLHAISATQWGQRQETYGYFDAETKGVVHEIGDLLAIIAIESLNLETTVESDYPLPAPSGPAPDPTSMYDPAQLQTICDAVEGLVKGDGVRAAPVLLGWAFVLSRVHASLVEQGVPDAYQALARTTLRIADAQPLFQAYASHALHPASALFPTLLAVVTSPLLGSQHAAASDPNALGYASVLRTLLTALPLLVRLSFLTPEQYAGLVDTVAAIYGTSAGSTLCTLFWTAYYAANEGQPVPPTAAGEREIVELAQSRFPVQFGPFIKLALGLADVPAAVSSSHDDSQEDSAGGEHPAQVAAQRTTDLLARLPSLTHVVHPTLGLPPAYEEHGYIGDVPRYRCVRAIAVSRGVVVPVGTLGTLVSERSRKPVVIAWELNWSAWKLFADVLEEAAMPKKAIAAAQTDVFGSGSSVDEPVALPIEWDSDSARAADITTIVDLFRTTITNQPSLAHSLLQHMAEGRAESYHFIEVVFRLLERSLANQAAAPSKLVSSLLGLVSNLLSSTPGAIWAFLRGSTVLYPAPTTTTTARWGHDSSRNAILAAERVAGTYPITLSLLDLIHALVLEEQISACAVTEPAFAAMKQGVLVRALCWVRDEIWTQYGSWRFKDLAEKYELAKGIVNLYRLVLDAGESAPLAAQGQFDPVVAVVVDALLAKATASQLAPILAPLSAGPEPILLLRKALRYADARAAELLVEATLALTLKLVRLRRHIAGTTSSLLETMCLTHGLAAGIGGHARRDLVASLGAFVTSKGVSSTASTSAARVLALLCVGSSEWQPRPPSFIALLGGSDKVERFVVAMLAIVEDINQEDLHVAIWDLISAVVETQPSLAMLLVTGRHYPFGPDNTPTSTAGEKESAVALLHQPLHPPPFPSLERTAVGVALEAVGTWTDAWRERPAILAAVLRFFDYTWQHLVDYGAALEQYRANGALWDNFVAIAFESAEDGTHGAEVAYCHRTMAKASAVRILALDIQAALVRPGADKAVSAAALLQTFAVQSTAAGGNRLETAVSVALKSDWAPDLHEKLLAQIHGAYGSISMDQLRVPRSTHPLDDADARPFGKGYFYSLPMLQRRIDGFAGSRSAGGDGDVDFDSADDEGDHLSEIAAAAALNINYSLLEAQISNTRAWRQLLEIALPLLRKSTTAAANTVRVTVLAATTIAEETRGGPIMVAVHEERLSILLSMVEVLHEVPYLGVKKQLVSVLSRIAETFSSEPLPPLDALVRGTTPAFHQTLFRTAYVALHKLNTFVGDERTAFAPDQAIALGVATDTILRQLVTATRDVLVLATTSGDRQFELDLSLAVSVVSQAISSPFAPPPSKWVAYCRAADLFRLAFEVITHMELLDGRPLYAQHVLDLSLALATASSLAAEAMALEGLMASLTNNALSAAAEAGTIDVTSRESGERTSAHELWTSMLALVVALVSALGEGTQFVEQEVTGFVRLYAAQIARSLAWTTTTPLTLAALEELQTVAALVRGVVRSAEPRSAESAVLAAQAVLLVQQINNALIHPRALAGLLRPVSPEERGLIERDIAATDVEPDKRTPLAERPVMARVTLAFLQIQRALLDSLVAHSDAWCTLSRDEVEWRVDRAIILPTTQVSHVGAPSIGTLFDLVDHCLDLTRVPIPASSPSPSPSPSFPSLPLLPYSPSLAQETAAQIVESTLLLATTQLALWLYRSSPTADRDRRVVISRTLAVELAIWLDKAKTLLGERYHAALVGFVDRRLVESDAS